MNAKHFDELIEVLKNHRNNGVRFNMGVFLKTGVFDEDANDGIRQDCTKGEECGTMCCAIGLLHLAHPEYELLTSNDSEYEGFVDLWPDDDFYESWKKLGRHFDIRKEDAEYLFAPYRYNNLTAREITINIVLERIKEVMYDYTYGEKRKLKIVEGESHD